ncbi:MAG TPA: GDP-mannose dehydrogenase [Thermoprotei archaeon]|nr:GDP-mannose dehydrogenase [Thermoprotei archaeon]
MRIAVIGLGEVGRPIYEIALERGFEVYGYDIDISKSVNKIDEIPENLDALHIALPCKDRENFAKIVLSYINRFKPRLVIIHSTVAPGTTRLIQENSSNTIVAYSPVRGKHPYIKQHLMFWPKWIALTDESHIDEVRKHLEQLGFKVKVASNPESLELAKIWETVYRAAMIAIWHEIHRTALKFNASITDIAEFISEVHRVLGDRPILYPDFIGGHCLIPNTILLKKYYDSTLLDFILESNHKRMHELEDERIKEEIRKVKEIWRRIMPTWYFKGHASEIEE